MNLKDDDEMELLRADPHAAHGVLCDYAYFGYYREAFKLVDKMRAWKYPEPFVRSCKSYVSRCIEFDNAYHAKEKAQNKALDALICFAGRRKK